MCTPRSVCIAGCFLLVFGSILLAIMFSEIYPRYTYTKNYIETECTVQNVEYYGEICCTTTVSDPDIWDVTNCIGVKYPCHGVKVSYNDASGVSAQGLLFGSYSDVVYQGANLTCSYYSCGSDNETSSDAVDSWLSSYAVVGSVFTCWYDSDDTSTLMKDVPIQRVGVIQAFLWTTVILVAGVVVTIIGYWAHAREMHNENEMHKVLLEGGENMPEIRTEGLYGYQNTREAAEGDAGRPDTASAAGIMVKSKDQNTGEAAEGDPGRPNTASAAGLMVKSKDLDEGNSLVVPGTTKTSIDI